MLKKILAGCATATLCFTLASEAKAECDGLYLALRAGVSNPDIGDSNTSGDRLDIDDNLLMISGALGYRYTYFRAEVEYIWHDKSKHSSSTAVPLPDGSNLVTSTSAKFDYKSYMFNVYYDLAPYTWFTPYLQAGIGLTQMEYTFNYADGSNKYDEDNFTWSLGAGISAKMTNRLNLDIGYRYFDMGKIGDGRVHNHEVYGGVRYVF